MSTDPPFPDVLGSTPLTFVTFTPFTVILDKSISISNELLVPIIIVASAGTDGLGHGVGSGVGVGVLLGVTLGVDEGGGGPEQVPSCVILPAPPVCDTEPV